MEVKIKSEPILFSVVIPTYNREKFLRRTVESVLAQTYPHFEIIIIDNKSTDNTFQIAQQLASEDKRIRVFQNEKNFERAYSRNRGMQLANGQFLTFLDSDDILLPHCLQEAYDFASKNSETKFFHGLYELRKLDGSLVYRYKFPSLDNQHKAIMEGNFLSCIAVFLHRDIYSKYRFDENPLLVGSEDYDLWIRIMAKHKLGRVNKVLAYITHHEGQTMAKQEIDRVLKRSQYIYDKIVSSPDLYEVYKSYLDIFWAHRLLFASTIAISSNQKTKALQFLIKTIKKKPTILASYKLYSILKQLLFS
ncbi:MAG: glycosyltransferase [Chlorobi bacterium]|nr:glycosyltransferase [Chlorobiota bacterium]